MSTRFGSLRFLVAGYGLPAELGIAKLFGHGTKPDQIRVLTHDADARNTGLIEMLKLRGVEYSTVHPKNYSLIEWIEAFQPDVILSLHYRSLIPERVLAAARLCALNLHPSLLPKYRGANSVVWAIINGETHTGFSYHHMSNDFDTGNILIQDEIKILDNDTSFSLFHRQIVMALERLDDVIDQAVTGNLGSCQVGEASYYGRALPFGGVIDTSWEETRIDRFIRSMYFPPFSPALVHINGGLNPVRSMEEYRQLLTNKLNNA